MACTGRWMSCASACACVCVWKRECVCTRVCEGDPPRASARPIVCSLTLPHAHIPAHKRTHLGAPSACALHRLRPACFPCTHTSAAAPSGTQIARTLCPSPHMIRSPAGMCHIFHVLSSLAVTRMGLVGCSAMLATGSRCPLNVFCSDIALGLAGANSTSAYGWRGCGPVIAAQPLLLRLMPLEPAVPAVPEVMPGTPPGHPPPPTVPSCGNKPCVTRPVLAAPPAPLPSSPLSPAPGVVPCNAEPAVVPRWDGPVVDCAPLRASVRGVSRVGEQAARKDCLAADNASDCAYRERHVFIRAHARMCTRTHAPRLRVQPRRQLVALQGHQHLLLHGRLVLALQLQDGRLVLGKVVLRSECPRLACVDRPPAHTLWLHPTESACTVAHEEAS